MDKRNKSAVYGAVCGDIIGSCYEFRRIKYKDFELFTKRSTFTDDTVMTCAVADWLNDKADIDGLIAKMQRFGTSYEHRGYGRSFGEWLYSSDPKPYNSFGNGSAMRVSPVGQMAQSIEQAMDVAEMSAGVTHNHPEGIKGAQAVAVAIYLAYTNHSKQEIKDTISDMFDYDLNRTVDEIAENYHFQVSCQLSVPEAIICYLEADTYEDAVRNAVSLGGDADTQACIAGAIAAATPGMEIPDNILDQCLSRLDPDLNYILEEFVDKYPR